MRCLVAVERRRFDSQGRSFVQPVWVGAVVVRQYALSQHDHTSTPGRLPRPLMKTTCSLWIGSVENPVDSWRSSWSLGGWCVPTSP